MIEEEVEGQKTGSGDEWMRAPMKYATLVMDMNFTPMEYREKQIPPQYDLPDLRDKLGRWGKDE